MLYVFIKFVGKISHMRVCIFIGYMGYKSQNHIAVIKKCVTFCVTLLPISKKYGYIVEG